MQVTVIVRLLMVASCGISLQHRRVHVRMAGDAGRISLSSSDEGMEDINKAGPSESRLAEIRQKVERLKGMESTMAEAEALLGGKASKRTNVTSVGGTWQKPSTVETYRPSGSGSWGVFERPRDMSKAMGGGRRVGVGAPDTETPEERAAKAQRTAELLAAYRSALGDQEAYEREHGDQIEEAITTAQRYMASGNIRRAICTLEPVWANVSAKSELGGKTGLELGMALDAAGDRDRAAALYEELTASRSTGIARKAKQLRFGIEAMEQLGVDAEADITGFSMLPELDLDRRFAQSVFAAPGSVDSRAEALAVLRLAASDLSQQKWSAPRVIQALDLLAAEGNDAVRPESPVTGVWRLVLRRTGDRVETDERAEQAIRLTDELGVFRVARRQALGPAVAQLDGGWQPRADMTKARLSFEACTLGPLRMQAFVPPPIEQRILVLDATLFVTMEFSSSENASGRRAPTFLVWTQ